MAEETTKVISMSVRPRQLAIIDRAARQRGLSRSRFLTLAGLLTANEVLELEDEEQPRPEPEEADDRD